MAEAGFLSFTHNHRRFFVTRAKNSGNPPILFLHGLGIGPIMYFFFILQLCQLGHPVFVIELPHLSLRFCLRAPSIDDIVSDIDQILELHKVEQCVVVGHSFGTFIASRLNALHSQKVAGLCLVDPVCCVMHNPKLVSAFVYRILKWGCFRDLIRSILVMFISHDLSIATSVCREFRWTQLNLWPEEIPAKTILFLTGENMMVPVEDVRRVFYQTDANVEVANFHSHGSLVINRQWRTKIINKIHEKIYLEN